MARIVDPTAETHSDTILGRFAAFPFASGEWTDGQTRDVTNDGDDKDFSVSITTFRVYLYQWQSFMNDSTVPVPDVMHVVMNRWRDPSFQRQMASRGCTDLEQAQRYFQSDQGWIWRVRTHIVSPGVIRFYFEPDDQ